MITVAPLRDDAPSWIDVFETTARQQHPSLNGWAPVTDYTFDARRAIEGPHPRRIQAVFGGLAVADVGCGPGHLVRLLREIGIVAVGYDRQVWPEWRRPLLQRRWFIGHTDITRHAVPRTPVVLCREVLEHLTLREIYRAIHYLCRSATQFVYVTMRLHPDPAHLLDVATHDTLDPTHITLPHPDLIRTLFVLEGLRRRPDLEAILDWQRQGRCFVYEHESVDAE